jgi:Flp pilus assembly protein TadG
VILTGDRGSGQFSALFGVMAMLSFFLLATQLLATLQTTSAVESAAVTAARAVATSPNPGTAVDTAEQQARSQLGGRANGAVFVWSSDSSAVTVTVSVESPALIPAALGHRWKRVSASAVVRWETLR